MTILQDLPLPPSGNRYWRHANNIVYRSAEAQAYIEEVQWRMNGVDPIDGPVAVTVWYCPARPKSWPRLEKIDGDLWPLHMRRLDVDNVGKVVLDALSGLAYHDDKQIVSLLELVGEPTEGGMVRVRISEVMTPDVPWVAKYWGVHEHFEEL